MIFPVSHGKKVVLAVIILLIFTTAFAIASGQKEDPISTARDLIVRNKLNDAILLLTETVRKHPDRIDEAEALMRQIRHIRGDYFTLWQQLIDTIKNEPNKPEKALAIIEQMKKLDAAPNQKTRDNLAEWQNIVQFRYNLDRFNKIMEAGDQFLHSGNYLEAIRTYLSGFDIFSPEFHAAGYSTSIVASADSAAKSTASEADAFMVMVDGIRKSAAAVAASFPGSSAKNIEVLVGSFSDNLTRVLATRDRLTSIADELTRLNDRAHLEKPSIQQNYYLDFLTWYIRGRPDAPAPEGINAVIAAALDASQQEIDKAAVARLQNDFSKAVGAYTSGSVTAARAGFQGTQVTGNTALAALKLWSRRLEVQPNLSLSSAQRARVKQALPNYLYAQQIAQSSADYLQLLDLKQSALAVEITPTDTADSLAVKLKQVQNLATQVQDAISGTEATISAFARAESTYPAPDALKISQSTLAAQNGALSDLVAQNTLIASDVADLQLQAYKKDYQTALADVDNGTKSLNGIEEKIGTGAAQITVISRYPDKAVTLFSGAAETLHSVGAGIDAYQNEYTKFANATPQGSKLRGDLSSVTQLSQEAAKLLATATASIVTAKKNVELAANLKTRAERALQQAQASISNQDAPSAVQSLQSARQYSIESLQLQADQAYSNQMDKQLAALGDEIKQVSYVQVVNKVRDLINTGRGEYQQDQFAQAEANLMQARSLWATVSPDQPQQEVENWLRLVQAALNLQNTRELTEVDPLFFTLGNYLNRARENFDTGRALFAKGDSQAGQQYLARAQQNIQSVVVARPFNQEARVLSLRILQITNPAQFPQIFRQRFEEAVNRSVKEPQPALIDMYDLRAIDANFPGLQNAIVALEIRLGVRPNPVTVARKQQSDALVAEARQLASTGSQVQTQVAIVRLENALQLNPDNTAAQVLLDRYRISLGSPATYTLPVVAMQEFSQAQNLFISGRLADSLAIVSRLWQNPTNRGYSPLVDLRNNILSRLGQ